MFRIFKFKNRPVVAVGDVDNKHRSDTEKAFDKLLDDVCDMSDKKGFKENNNEKYASLLEKIDNFLTQHPEMVNLLTDDKFKVTPMHIAAGSGLFDLVKVLAKHNPDLSLQNCFGETPAVRARNYGKRADIADYLDSLSLSNDASKNSDVDAVRSLKP